MSTPLRRTVPVANNSRMNLSADMRRAIGLPGEGYLVLTVDGDEIRATTQEQMLKHVHALLSPYKPENEWASEQLSRERRHAVAREDDELGGSYHG